MATPSLEPNFIDQAAPIPMYPDVALKLTGDITHLITFTSLSLLYLSCLEFDTSFSSINNTQSIIDNTLYGNNEMGKYLMEIRSNG